MNVRIGHQLTSTTKPCVFDRHRLSTLEALLGAERAAFAVDKFKGDLDSRVAAITQAATEAEKGSHAHKLAGAAGTIGLAELCEECRRFEAAVKRNCGDLEPFLDALVSATSRAKMALEELKR